MAGQTWRGVEHESKFWAVIRGFALVTGQTGDRLVRATERIVRLFMLGHQEACRSKGLHRMALFAITLRGALRELAVMEV